MKTSNDLKQERNKLVTAQNEVTDLATAENREFTAEESKEVKARHEQIRALDAQIEIVEAAEDAKKRAAQVKGESLIEAPAIHRKDTEPFSLLRSLSTIASGKQLRGKAAEVNEEAISEMKEQGLEVGDGLRMHLPSRFTQKRSQTITGDSGAKGGALVASEPQLVMPLLPNIDVFRNLGVNEMGGLVGDVPLPTSEAFSFSYVGETEDVSETDVNIAGPTLKPKRCAGVAGWSNKFLRQTSISAETFLINLVNNAYGAAVIENGLNGAAGDAPNGLYNLITTNIDATAGAPTKAIVTGLESLVDDANGTRVSRGYISDPKLANKMKNTPVDAGSGIFLFEGGELEGYTYERTTLMPTLDAGASHPLIFGDWSQFTVGYWGNVSIMVDPYTLASQSKVRLIIEGFSDVALTNEKAFAINKVLTV